MATSGGPNIVTDGLVFGYDTGYPQIKSNSDSYKFNKGEPTINLLTESEQDPRTWSGKPTADKTLLSETYRGLPVYRLQDADGVDPDVYVDNYQSVAFETGLTQGDVYVFSFYFRVIQHNNIADTTANNSAWVWYAGTTDSIYWNDFELNKWHKAELEATVGATYSQLLPRIDYDNSIVDICGLQFEKKSHATPFTTGTRSASGSLFDLTRQRDIDLSNVSFDSNAQMVFDGTDDRIDTSLYHLSGSDHTEEVVVYRSATGVTHGILSDLQYGFYGLYIGSNDKVSYKQMQQNPGPSYPNVIITSTSTLGIGYHHIVGSFSKENGFKLYVNGVLEASNSTNLPFNLAGSRGINHIGVYKTSAYTTYTNPMNGYIPIVKCYNRELSLLEVQQSYNSIKSRFNL